VNDVPAQDVMPPSVITGNYERWEKLPITPKQEQMWLEVRSKYVWSQPGLTSVWFSMMADKDKTLGWFTNKIRVAACDDTFMYINPDTYFSLRYNLLNRVFIAGHEIIHAICGHCGVMRRLAKQGFVLYPDGLKLPFILKYIQASTDCFVNDMLIQSQVGEKPEEAWHMPLLRGQPFITYMDDIYSAYRKFYQYMKQEQRQQHQQHLQQQQGQGNSQSTPGRGNKNDRDNNQQQNQQDNRSFDEHLAPGEPQGKNPNEAEAERDQQAWDNAVRLALAAAKAQGKLPLAMERGLSKLLTPRVQWQDQLWFTVSRKMGNDRSTWEDLNNELMLRGIGAPGRKGFSCRLIVCVGDSSGSIGQRTADMFFGECGGILEEMRPQRLILIQCDAAICEVVDIDEPSDLVRKIVGGGGTDFNPPFEWIDSEGLQPDAVIYLTDLEGSFPTRQPDYPVIWATIRDHAVPWGDKVLIPEQIEDRKW